MPTHYLFKKKQQTRHYQRLTSVPFSCHTCKEEWGSQIVCHNQNCIRKNSENLLFIFRGWWTILRFKFNDGHMSTWQKHHQSCFTSLKEIRAKTDA